MYCPLCKAEYRTGFDKCSDCLTALVSTLEEANATSVVLLWKGTSQSKFNGIVDALRDANVPTLARSGASSEMRSDSIWNYIPVVSRYKRASDQMTWEVSVLNSDYAKARGIVEKQA
jgi:hypothetical protein